MSSVDTAVRRLEAGDCELVLLLERMWRAAAADYRGADVLLDEVPAVGAWSDHVGDDSRPVWVGTVDGVAAGYLCLDATSDVASVRQVFVHPEARELGLGDDLLAAALAFARSRDCVRFEGAALPGDRLTKNLYERAGIVARKVVLSTSLD
ncbi:MAG: GNAT family N-acetyltransferase [Ilumatobacteraceae bacterium]